MPREYYPEHRILPPPPDVIYLCPRCQGGLVRDLRAFAAGYNCGKCGGDEKGIRYVKIVESREDAGDRDRRQREWYAWYQDTLNHDKSPLPSTDAPSEGERTWEPSREGTPAAPSAPHERDHPYSLAEAAEPIDVQRPPA